MCLSAPGIYCSWDLFVLWFCLQSATETSLSIFRTCSCLHDYRSGPLVSVHQRQHRYSQSPNRLKNYSKLTSLFPLLLMWCSWGENSWGLHFPFHQPRDAIFKQWSFKHARRLLKSFIGKVNVFQAPRRLTDSYKCCTRHRKRSTRTLLFACRFFRLRMSTRSFKFNCVYNSFFFNCVFTQIRCLPVSLSSIVSSLIYIYNQHGVIPLIGRYLHGDYVVKW